MSEIDFNTRSSFKLLNNVSPSEVIQPITLPKNRMEANSVARECIKSPAKMEQLLVELLIKTENL